MTDELRNRLSGFPEELGALRNALESMIGFGFKIQSDVIEMSQPPKLGDGVAATIFPGISQDLIAKYERIHAARSRNGFQIPDQYRKVLQVTSGAFVYEMNLYGIPLSMAEDPPRLTRAAAQPLDLATANQDWAGEFRSSKEQFHFGSAPYSEAENLGYFLNPDGSIEAHRRGGKVHRRWPGMSDFLQDEIARVADRYPEYVTNMAQLMREIAGRDAGTKRRKRNLS